MCGESGDYWKLTRAVMDIGCSLMAEHAWTVVLAPLMAAIPAVTLVNLLRETWFAHVWGRRLDRSGTLPLRQNAAAQEAFLRCGSSSASS